jgi:hypothetical protein
MCQPECPMFGAQSNRAVCVGPRIQVQMYLFVFLCFSLMVLYKPYDVLVHPVYNQIDCRQR